LTVVGEGGSAHVTASRLLVGLACSLETNRQGLSDWKREEIDLACHVLKTVLAAHNGKQFVAYALRCVLIAFTLSPTVSSIRLAVMR
jgi:hypothetical protein